jgi:hypothetical protein
MSDLTNQAIDMVFKNDALQDRVIKPIKKRTYPYIIVFSFFNILLLVLVCYLIKLNRRIAKLLL